VLYDKKTAMEIPLEQLNAKIFREHVNTEFIAHLNDGKTLPLKLEEVEERNTSARMELFFLRFRGPGAPFLSQKSYRMEHEELGAMDIFITATGADASGIQYEAVFHRYEKDSH
jgi:hypothetical protein